MVFVLHEIRVDIGGVGLGTHVVLGIAHTLNSEGVLAPQPQKGRFSRSGRSFVTPTSAQAACCLYG